MNKLQVALLQLTQSGVLLNSDKSSDASPASHSSVSHAMPASWVRATMIVRCNATARGHSAVTLEVLQTILALLRHGLTPVIPLRGTVSASGDLMPLAYIAGVLEGNPDIVVRNKDGSLTSAEDALVAANLRRITFGPKEALGLVNGTAPSAALASLVIYDAHQLAVLVQALTAMAVEALLGNSESFHPFIALVRPHDGQIEASRNIRSFLQNSAFAQGVRNEKNRNPVGLVQDRYALRSAPQWIGPQLEDLMSAHRQVAQELNSSADNPLVDVDAKEVYYGANFQAAAITSAMEKSRLALQMLGKLLFAQSTEIIDPSLNNGLPANLAADDPSTSFTVKGVDINMAAYMSELAFLASPVSSHVQAAEMHNQSINSLAFLSARMTQQAVELVSLMVSSGLFIGCQALDLRALQRNFFDALPTAIGDVNGAAFATCFAAEELAGLNRQVINRVEEAWKGASRLDVADRFDKIIESVLPVLIWSLQGGQSEPTMALMAGVGLLQSWEEAFRHRLAAVYRDTFARFQKEPNTTEYLGVGSRALYTAVRDKIKVPFHLGVTDHPVGFDDYGEPGRSRKTVGSWISAIYEALLEGKITDALYGAVGDAPWINGSKGNGVHFNGDQGNGLQSNGSQCSGVHTIGQSNGCQSTGKYHHGTHQT